MRRVKPMKLPGLKDRPVPRPAFLAREAQGRPEPSTARCDCRGTRHTVCGRALRPATIEVDWSAPPARPKTWTCDVGVLAGIIVGQPCGHAVCDPSWATVRESPALTKPVAFLSRRAAIKEGLVIRPLNPLKVARVAVREELYASKWKSLDREFPAGDCTTCGQPGCLFECLTCWDRRTATTEERT